MRFWEIWIFFDGACAESTERVLSGAGGEDDEEMLAFSPSGLELGVPESFSMRLFLICNQQS